MGVGGVLRLTCLLSRRIILLLGKKHRLYPTITQLVRHYLMAVLTGVAVVAGWVYFVFRPPPALGMQTAHDIIHACS